MFEELKKIYGIRSTMAAISTYKNILSRCNNVNHYNFKTYGGKGVRCLISKSDFIVFYHSSSICPRCGNLFDKENKQNKRGLTIDRINSNGNYEIQNMQLLCRSCNSSKSMKGAGHSHSVLTDKIVIESRQKYKNGASIKSLSKEYSVPPDTLKLAVLYKNWKHLP